MKWLKLDTTITPIYAKNIQEFNEYVDKYKCEHEIILTKGNNISQKNLRNLPCSKVWKRANHMEFQYIDGHQQIRVIYAIHYDEQSDNDPTISYHALYYFKGLMELIPTDDVEVYEPIVSCPENPTKKYYNYCNPRIKDFTLDNCYSLDRNSSFLASLQEVYPQSKPWVDKYQQDKLRIKAIPKEQRTKEEQEILSYDKIFIGWFNNPKYHRSHAWNRVINNANAVIHKLRKEIEATGHTILLVNTDAVKFIGKYDYQTSTDIGGFKFEWEDTKMYVKSVKSYAYFDKAKNKWSFKQAGKCKLDLIKPDRETWTLDDYKKLKEVEIAHIVIDEKTQHLKEIYY